MDTWSQSLIAFNRSKQTGIREHLYKGIHIDRIRAIYCHKSTFYSFYEDPSRLSKENVHRLVVFLLHKRKA